MTITANVYPTAYVVYELLQDYLKKTQEAVADWDEFVYDFLSDNYDHLYLNDVEWFNNEDSDIKDELRDELLEMLGCDI